MVAEFLGDEARNDHFSESEESDLFLNATASQDSATNKLVGKVDLACTVQHHVIKTRTLAIANRSHISCAHNTSRASIVTLCP